MKRKKIAFAVSAVLAAGHAATYGQEEGTPAGLGAPPQLEEIFVLGKFIPDEKRDTSEISNVLTAEDMAVLGDSDVASSLERVTGLSLVGGKYVYVRGLGERYSSTLLNGSPISSPVPFQKTVPLDIVPNSLVSNLLVQKTFSAQYPGDFSGGLVLIRTKTIPDENYISVGAQTGGNSKSTGGDGLTYRGGGDDNSGWDDGTRDIPETIRVLNSEEFEETEFPERAALGASFYNYWRIKERDLNPDVQGELELGYRHDFDNGMALGVTGAGKYNNEWRKIDVDMRRYEFTGIDGAANQTVQFNEQTTTQTIDVSAFLNIGWEINGDNSISLTNVFLRQTEDLLEQRVGLSSEDNVINGIPVESYFMQWVENEIRSYQLSGEHFLSWIDNPDAVIRWRALTGDSQRDAPDTRRYTYSDNFEGQQEIVTPARQAAGDLRNVNTAPDRLFSKQKDDLEQYGLDVEYPMYLGDVDVTFKAGYSTYQRERDVEERTFRFNLTTSAPEWIPLQTPDQFFDTPNWARNYITVTDFSAGAANTSGIFPFAFSKEEIDGYYAAFDAQLTPRLRLQAGVREEDTDLTADAWGGNTDPRTVNFVTQEYSDTLPAGSITFEVIPDMQVRFAYSETRNRPSLLEITGTTIRNPDNGFNYRGNVFLEQAELKNWDARWEWYFGQADSMSLGLFYKDFKNPIEIGKIQAQNDIFTWFNADEAELKGIEYDIRKDLYLGEWFGWGANWDNFTLGFNISYIDSQVTLLGSDETAEDVPLTGGRRLGPLFENERPLTGQSDWLGNLILSYESFDLGLKGSLAYNYTGDRIVLVGDRNDPNIEQEARGQLDFTLKYTFYRWDQEMELEFKARNLLDEEYELTQGGRRYEQWETGLDWSLGITARF